MVRINFKEWLGKFEISNLKIKTGILEMDWKPQEEDKTAAWELYVELLTRITTQPLADTHGDEQTALTSVYSIFPTTRDVMKRNGRGCVDFTKIAVIVLNQKIRPFTTKWHKLASEGKFTDKGKCEQFRSELVKLQVELKIYMKMLADIADVEDLTELENET